MDFYGLFVSVRECVRGKFVTYIPVIPPLFLRYPSVIPPLFLRYPSVIPPLSLRSGIGVVTVLQGYCKGIAKVLYKPVMNP